MRVISGIYKHRHFDVPRNFKARPTTDFAKENLFNVLSNRFDYEEDQVEGWSCCRAGAPKWCRWRKTATIMLSSAGSGAR